MPKRVLIPILSIAVAIGLNNILFLIELEKYSPAYQKAAEILYNPPFRQQILMTGILMPIVEEVLFRGGIYRLLRKWMKFPMAMLISAVLFGIYHGNLVQFVYATLCGMLLAYFYEIYHSIKAPITAHISMNIVACVFTEFGIFTWMFGSMIRVLLITAVMVGVAGITFVALKKNSKNWMLQKC